MTWLVTDYPFGPAGIFTNAQRGEVANVPADGSAEIAVVFAVPFATTPTTLLLSINNVNASGSFMLTVQYDHLTATGFDVYVAGATGGTVTVAWLALQ